MVVMPTATVVIRILGRPMPLQGVLNSVKIPLCFRISQPLEIWRMKFSLIAQKTMM